MPTSERGKLKWNTRDKRVRIEYPPFTDENFSPAK